MTKLTLRFPADHPTGAGHFPGNPIIPGALLLAEVLRSMSNATGQHFVACQVKSAKFLHPVRPGDSVEVEYAAAQGTNFKCTVAGTPVLSGTLSATTNA